MFYRKLGLVLRGAEPVDDGFRFAWGEGFSLFVIAHGLELVPEHVVAADHHHEVVDRYARGAVGEVEEGQLFFGVGFHGCLSLLFTVGLVNRGDRCDRCDRGDR